MAIDFSSIPSPTSAQQETGKDVMYKTKEINFRRRRKHIILQNKNGPCPLIAISNVLLLRENMNRYSGRFEVSQDELLALVGNRLIESNKDPDSKDEALHLLPCIVDGINVDIKFRRIDDFVPTSDIAIFDLLNIPLYHGWIVDPQEFETATAIGCKSYNDLSNELVALETQTVKAQSGLSSGECSVDFAAALGVPSPCCSKTSSFTDSTPASAEHHRLGKGDIEEERLLAQALQLSEKEVNGFDTRRDSSSGAESVSVSGFSDEYQMSEDDAASGCTSTPGSNISQLSKSLDQISFTESKDDVGEESSGAFDLDQLSSRELRDEMVENTSKMTAVHVTCSEAIPVEKTNLESTKIDSISKIPLKSEAVTCVNPDFSDRTQDDEEGGESLVGKSSWKGRGDTKGLTPREGEVIKNFLNDGHYGQLTVTGLSYLREKVKEDELCVFFRNNHFLTMLKHKSELYLLVTDQGYLMQQDLVWEKFNKVNGDSVYMTGNLEVFNGKWDQGKAVSNAAEYICSVNSSLEKGMEIDPDLEMAIALQQQELARRQ